MDPNPLTQSLTRALRSRKQALVDAHGIGSDLAPMLVTACRGRHLGAYPIRDPHDSHEIVALTHTAIALSAADTAVFISEHYIAADGDHQAVRERFALGDPAVSEAIAFVVVAPTPTSWDVDVYFDAYRYEGKRVVYHRAGDEGLAQHLARIFVALARPAFEAQAERAGPPVLGLGSKVELLGSHRLNDHEALVGFALHTNCPCGSNRPMNQCCAN